MKKKIITTLLLFLLLSTIILSFTQVKSNRLEDTIYVDDDNVDGPWYGTKQYPYKEIQDGIDVANNGDTVFVFEGNYTTCIISKQNISLVGENRKKTIINNDGISFFFFFICSKYTLIDNFTITGSKIGLDIDKGKNTISNNIIKLNGIGILIRGDKNIIINNIIKDNGGMGVYFDVSDHNEINNNLIINNSGNGIINDYSINNTFFKNLIKNNTPNGIELKREKLTNRSLGKNIFEKNTFVENKNNVKNIIHLSYIYTNFLNNYWDRPRFFPYIIKSELGLPSNIDWFPSLKPHHDLGD